MSGDGVVRADGRCRVRRPRERDHIHGLQLIQQSGGTAADDGQRARRQYAGIDHILDHALGQPGGGRGRLDDDGHAREQGRCRFLPQPPGREVEGVDEQRHAACRDLDMPRQKNAVLGQRHGFAVAQMPRIAERCTPSGVLVQGVDAAVHIDGGVVSDSAAVGGGYLVIRVTPALQHGCNIGQQPGALRIAQRAQRLAAGIACKGKGGAQIEPCGIDTHQLGSQYRVA